MFSLSNSTGIAQPEEDSETPFQATICTAIAAASSAQPSPAGTLTLSKDKVSAAGTPHTKLADLSSPRVVLEGSRRLSPPRPRSIV